MSKDHQRARLSDESVMRSGAPWLARWLRPELAVLVSIFILFYYFKLANYAALIDDEVAAVRTSPDIWLTQGRWGAYLFEWLVLPNPVIPFLPVFLFGLFIGTAYLFLLSAHDVERPRLLHYATFPLFAAFPTWLFLAAFAANIAAAGLGMLFSCLAALAYRKLLGRGQAGLTPDNWLLVGGMSVSGCVAMGIYQTFLFVIAVAALGVLLTHSRRMGASCVAVIVDAALLLLALIVGILLYKAIDLAFLRLAGVEASGYVGQFFDVGRLLANPAAMLAEAFDALSRTYRGDASYYGVGVIGFPLLMLAGALSIVFARGTITLAQRALGIAIGAILVVAPFVMHLLSGGMPLRTMVAVPAVVWLFGMLGLTSGRRWIEGMASVALILSLFGILHVSNTIQAADTYARAHDRILAADLYRRIAEANPGFDRGKPHIVDIFGGKEFDSLYPRGWSSTWGYSFFEWDGGNPYHRMLPHMRALGYTNLVLAPPAQREANLAAFNEMPAWPATGAVRVVGGVTLIKLGSAPGYPFNLR